MKIFAALLAGASLLALNGAWATETVSGGEAQGGRAAARQATVHQGTASSQVKTAAYEPAVPALPPAISARGCKAGEPGCAVAADTRSCGAFAGSKRHGYGFGASTQAATSRAQDMCGAGNQCQVVVAACED